MNARGAAFALVVAAASPAAAQTVAPPGATACSGCHAPASVAATAVPPLHGRAPNDIVAAMQEFRSGQRPATVMDRLAKGFSSEEIQAIAAWYGAQK